MLTKHTLCYKKFWK